MFGLLQNFEQAAGRFSPVVLIGLGIILVLAGLFVWLGGLGLTKILAGVVGAVAGAVCGFFVIRRTIASAVFLATVMTAVAVIFERIFFIILTAALALVVSFAVLAWPYLGIPQQLSAADRSDSCRFSEPAMSAGETVEVVKDYFVNINYQRKTNLLTDAPVQMGDNGGADSDLLFYRVLFLASGRIFELCNCGDDACFCRDGFAVIV